MLKVSAEHETAVGAMAKLNGLAHDDEMWKAWLTVMQEGVTHHIKEEEGDMFKRARTILSKERREEMAVEYAAMKAAGPKPSRPAAEPVKRTPAHAAHGA